MDFSGGNSFADRDVRLLEANVHNTAMESVISPVKTSASDDITEASTNPSTSSSLNVADGTVDTKPLFGLEGVKSFEDILAAMQDEDSSEAAESSEVEVIYVDFEKQNKPSAESLMDKMQQMKTELKRFVSDKNLELHTVEKEVEDEAESAASASKPKEEAKNEVDGFLELAADKDDKDTEAALSSEVKVIYVNFEKQNQPSAASLMDKMQQMKTESRKFVSDENLELHTVETEFEDEAESAASASKPKVEAKNEVDGFLELATSASTELEAAEKSVDGFLELTASASTEEAADKAGSRFLKLAAPASTEEAVEKSSACSSTGLVKEGLVNHVIASKDDKDTEAVSTQKDDESEHPSTVSSVAKVQKMKKDAEESSAKTRESVGTDATVKVSREKKATIPATAALHHADVSYIPWLGVQLEYKPMPAMPEIWEDDVLIRVEATTISTRDCLERIRRDNDVNLHSDSWVPGHEIVGRVVRVGGKSRFLKNRRVAALLPAGGGCSRHVRCHVDNLIAVPEHARSQDIVYLLSTYLTAYQCLEQSVEADQISCCVPLKMAEYLHDLDEEGESLTAERMRNPLFGKSVLITGGSPVGQALIDIARHAGATVYALSHSQHEYNVQQMGVKEGGWYPLFQTEGWKTKWKGKMDVIVDTIGDYGNYASFYDVLAFGGRFVRVNTTSAGKKFISAPIQGGKYFSPLKHYKESHINRAAVDYDIFDSFEEDKKLFTEDLTYLFQLLQSGKIKRREFSHIGLEMVEQEWNKAFEGKTDVLVVSCNESGSGSRRCTR